MDERFPTVAKGYEMQARERDFSSRMSEHTNHTSVLEGASLSGKARRNV